MPHGFSLINENNMDGHTCIHFLNSRTHGTDRVDEAHQAAVAEAYRKRNELYKKVGKETRKISTGIYISVQTIPSSLRGYLNVEFSLKRWIPEPKDYRKVFIPNDKISFLGINEYQYQKIIGYQR